MRQTLMAVLVLVLALILACPGLASTVVTQAEATFVAENYLSYKLVHDAWNGYMSATVNLKQVLENDQGEILGYYFQADPQGWMVISAHKELAPVKFYMPEDSLDFDNREGLSALIWDKLSVQVEYLQTYPTTQDLIQAGASQAGLEKTLSDWQTLSQPSLEAFYSSLSELDEYMPGTILVDFLWHQSYPYNEMCPEIDNQRTPVGCVATATAQIMAYWSQPLQGEGQNEYFWIEGNQMVSADFSDPYDWDNIIPAYVGGETQVQINAVAELCFEVGVAFEMQYGLNGSFATTSDAVTVLPQFFRYSNEINRQNRVDYPVQQDWFNMLRAELDQERPMLYRIVGHAIVCDGWTINDFGNYIHINYGWGGPYSAWFALDEIPGSVDPETEEYVVRNIEPTYSQVEFEQHNVDGGLNAYYIHAGNFNGDGYVDILSATNLDVILYLQESPNSWVPYTVATGYFYTAYAQDFDNDGHMDIMASHPNGVSWYENVGGTGLTWTEHIIADDVGNIQSIYTIDMDEDGDLDVCCALTSMGQVVWYEQDEGNWIEHIVSEDFSNPNSIQAADVDEDGDIDVLCSSVSLDRICWWERTGPETWIRHTIVTNFDYPSSIYVADINNDDHVDLVGASYSYIGNQIVWWEWDEGNWIQHLVAEDFNYAQSVYATDMDNDNDVDILGAAYSPGKITWWEQVGGNWIRHDVVSIFDAQSVYATDMDNDNDVDILGATPSGDVNIAWWEHLGAPGLSYPITITLSPHGLPIEIPDDGGDIVYGIHIENHTSDTYIKDIWSEAILPNSTSVGPFFQINNLPMGGFFTLTADNITQYVPSTAPHGQYYYVIKMGDYPNADIVAGFPFSVVSNKPNAIDELGEFSWQPENWPATGWQEAFAPYWTTDQETPDLLPTEFSLLPPYPNPFNPTTTIGISLPQDSQLQVTVYDILGREAENIFYGTATAGYHQFAFQGNNLASGIYFVRATVPGRFNQVRKVILMK